MTDEKTVQKTFRIHHAGGHTDVLAADPLQARERFSDANPKLHIARVKLVKGGEA
ncbi:hypothetical protein [Rhizobium sp. SSA_523]|uniref:hypothetical protein n=1 Tax=Rhizobium sp. SSA_523 TaxID=2952477 RepID=UPI002091B6D0|nr:hypothetical protein [Rhizobium sp. SSA_523]WKC25212.1 hypothetical protein QTJ18_14595 [Rhizobium sp. SSA_523]